jgi:hypothetical protein
MPVQIAQEITKHKSTIQQTWQFNHQGATGSITPLALHR